MTARDPYQVLGVARAATPDELKSAYRRLAKEFHPDSDPGNPWIENKFKEISAAYDLLSDPARRAQYDKGWIDADGNLRRRKGPGGAGDPRGRKRGHGEKVEVRGANVAYTLWITFAEAARGTSHRIRLTTGKEVEVKVPPGTTDGVILRLKNQGMPGVGGAGAGDAHIEVRVEGDPRFTAKGKDIFPNAPSAWPRRCWAARPRSKPSTSCWRSIFRSGPIPARCCGSRARAWGPRATGATIM